MLRTTPLLAFIFVVPSLVAYFYCGDKPFYGDGKFKTGIQIGVAVQLLLSVMLLCYMWYNYAS